MYKWHQQLNPDDETNLQSAAGCTRFLGVLGLLPFEIQLREIGFLG